MLRGAGVYTAAVRRAILILFAASLLGVACKRERPVVVTLATTTSVQDTGLFDRLEPIVEKRIGADVRMIAVGSGQALLLAKKGEADVVIAHSPADELAAVAEGYVFGRRPLMWNTFVIVGPPDDPAHVRDAADPAEALRRIAASGATFISRGDASGTHKRELALWSATGVPRPAMVRETGQGQGETLLVADELRAYSLTDSSTFSRTRVRHQVALFDPATRPAGAGPSLVNTYSVLRAKPASPRPNAAAADAFAEWMLGAEAAAVLTSGGLFFAGSPSPT